MLQTKIIWTETWYSTRLDCCDLL